MLQTTTRAASQKGLAQHKTRSLAFAGRTLKALQRGFSLVEIALVLVIAGVALGAGITVLSAKFTQAKIDTTKTRAEAIRVALTNYVAQNYRLPCPAAPGIVKGNSNYNSELRVGAAPSFVCNAVSGLNATIGGTGPLAGVSRGTVPCATLGIAEDACTDGYGNRFTYFVDNRAVNLTSATVSGMRGIMTVHKMIPPAAPTPTVGAAPTGNQINACSSVAGDNSCNLAAVAMVISHGANNGGAFAPGSATPYATTNISTYEIANTDNNIQFIQNDYVEKGTGSFDDVVVAIVPRDLITTLNQTGIVKQPNVSMNERFATIKVAILNQMFNAAPTSIAPEGAAPDRGLQIAPGSLGPPLAQNFPTSVLQTQYCPTPITSNTLQLPLVTDVQPLSVASGLRVDVWGNPIRYKLFATNGIAKPGSCAGAGTVPKAHICAPAPDVAIRSGQCQTAFVLVSYGPNGIANTGASIDDDIFYPVTNQEVTDFVQRSGGW